MPNIFFMHILNQKDLELFEEIIDV